MADNKPQSRKEIIDEANKTMCFLASKVRDYNNRVIGQADIISFEYEYNQGGYSYSKFVITSEKGDY